MSRVELVATSRVHCSIRLSFFFFFFQVIIVVLSFEVCEVCLMKARLHCALLNFIDMML